MQIQPLNINYILYRFEHDLELPFLKLTEECKEKWISQKASILNLDNKSFRRGIMKKCINKNLENAFTDYINKYAYTFYLLKSILTYKDSYQSEMKNVEEE